MSHRIALSKPVESKGEMVHEVELREPTVNDLVNFDKAAGGHIEKTVVMIESLSNITRSAILAMSAKDYLKVSAMVDSFLDDTPATGD